MAGARLERSPVVLAPPGGRRPRRPGRASRGGTASARDVALAGREVSPPHPASSTGPPGLARAEHERVRPRDPRCHAAKQVHHPQERAAEERPGARESGSHVGPRGASSIGLTASATWLPVPTGGGAAAHVNRILDAPAAVRWSPPPALEAFLARGGPVVSPRLRRHGDARIRALTRLVLGAVRKPACARCCSRLGRAHFPSDESDVFSGRGRAHDWLFPRVRRRRPPRRRRHDGRSARAASGHRRPSPWTQPFWGSRVAALAWVRRQSPASAHGGAARGRTSPDAGRRGDEGARRGLGSASARRRHRCAVAFRD